MEFRKMIMMTLILFLKITLFIYLFTQFWICWDFVAVRAFI